MLKHRLIVFEKDNKIRDFLSDGNLVVLSCSNLNVELLGKEFLSADTIVVDIDEFRAEEVIEFISDNSDKNIIVLNSDKTMIYQLYECGAVDVMIKPLDEMELKYKIDAMIRKRKYRPKKYFIGDLIYEIETGTLTKDDKSIVLPSLQNKIFSLLLNGYYDNRIVKKEEVFNSMIDESSRVQNHIARLRYSLAFIQSKQVIIETVYSKGYKIVIFNG